MKIFDLFDMEGIEIKDPALKKYINLDARLVLKSHGRHTEKFGKLKVNIIERFVNLISIPGHRGKKHKIQTSRASGKYHTNINAFLKSLKIIEEKTKANPIQILIRAIENSAPRDEITTIEYGGARYPQAVDVSPLRRLNLALRNLVHGSYDRSFGKKKKISEALAEEILLASENSMDSSAVKKRNESEKQADSAR